MSGLIGITSSRSKLVGGSENGVHSWCRWKTNGSGHEIRRSFNIASIVDTGVAGTRLIFMRPHRDAYYSIAASTIAQTHNAHGVNSTGQTTAQYEHTFYENNGTVDGEFRSVTFGD